MSEQPVVLVSLDTERGVFRRYRRGANGRPIFEESVRVEPWEPVLLGVIALDPDMIEKFRRGSSVFCPPPEPMAA